MTRKAGDPTFFGDGFLGKSVPTERGGALAFLLRLVRRALINRLSATSTFAVLLTTALLTAHPVLAAGAQADTTKESATATTVQAGGTADYKLGSGDKVRIIVFNEPTLSGEFAISTSGSLSLPLIGDVSASGRSVREVVADIEAKYADGYLRAPQVSLEVLTFRPYYILGEVTKPGEYPYTSGLTVFNAVARAEGFTYRANKRKAFIKHANETEEHLFKLVPGLQVLPGDTIRIGERYF